MTLPATPVSSSFLRHKNPLSLSKSLPLPSKIFKKKLDSFHYRKNNFQVLSKKYFMTAYSASCRVKYYVIVSCIADT